MTNKYWPGRDRKIVKMHLEDRLSLSEIGRRVGLSHERVRQIVRKEGVPVEFSRPIARQAIGDALRGPRIGVACEQCGRVEDHRESTAIKRRFCSMECRSKGLTIKKQVLIDYLRELGERLGRTPGQADLIREDGYSHTTYYRAFGSLRRAQELAGFEPNQLGGWRGGGSSS